VKLRIVLAMDNACRREILGMVLIGEMETVNMETVKMMGKATVMDIV
jgi:hypothetical protein